MFTITTEQMEQIYRISGERWGDRVSSNKMEKRIILYISYAPGCFYRNQPPSFQQYTVNEMCMRWQIIYLLKQLKKPTLFVFVPMLITFTNYPLSCKIYKFHLQVLVLMLTLINTLNLCIVIPYIAFILIQSLNLPMQCYAILQYAWHITS